MCWTKFHKISLAVALLASPAFAVKKGKAKAKKPTPADVERQTAADFLASAKVAASDLANVLRGRGLVRLEGCPKPPPGKWAALLLMGEPIDIEYKFAPECDAEGILRIEKTPFPVDLKIRNVAHGDRLRGNVTTEMVPDWKTQEMRVIVYVKDGLLDKKGRKNPIGFTAAYRISTGIDAKEAKGRTGELHIVRFEGRDVDVREPLK